MNVGIVLAGREPKDGGGYTITKDLFDALIKRKNYVLQNFIFISKSEDLIRHTSKTSMLQTSIGRRFHS